MERVSGESPCLCVTERVFFVAGGGGYVSIRSGHHVCNSGCVTERMPEQDSRGTFLADAKAARQSSGGCSSSVGGDADVDLVEGGFEAVGGVVRGSSWRRWRRALSEMSCQAPGRYGRRRKEDGGGHGFGTFPCGDGESAAVGEGFGCEPAGGGDDGVQRGHGFEELETEAFDAGGDEPGVGQQT